MKKSVSLLLALLTLMALLTGCVAQSATTPAEEAPVSAAAAQEAPAAAVAPAEAGKETRVIRLAASDSAEYPLCKTDTFFAEKVAELSGGAVKIETFFSGVLGEEGDTVEGLSLGTLEMTRVNAGNMATFIPALELFNLPYLFVSREQCIAAITGEVRDIYAGLFEAAGYKLITFYEEGSRYVFNKTECVTSLDQLRGLKIRTMGAQSIQDGFKAMGASPTPMSSGEVYTSLSQGVIDATENNYSTVYDGKYYEVAKYFSNTAHMRVPSILVCSLDYWNSLSTEEQSWIDQAADEAFDYALQVFDESEDFAFNKMIEEGCVYTELSPEQIAAIAAPCKSVHEKYAVDETSKKILESINSLA